jgi:biotin operon repressor
VRCLRVQRCAERQAFERQAFLSKAFRNSIALHTLHLLNQLAGPALELQEELGFSETTLSQDIAKLNGTGLVVRHRQSKHLCLSLSMPEAEWACGFV